MAVSDISVQFHLKLFNDTNNSTTYDNNVYLTVYLRFYKYYNEINIDYFEIKS